MREDCSVVLFLLIFNNQIKGSPSNADFALPSLIFEKLKVPFSCQTFNTAPDEDEQNKFTGKFPNNYN